MFCLKLKQLSPGVWNCVFVSFFLLVSEELGPGASLHLGNCFPGKTLSGEVPFYYFLTTSGMFIYRGKLMLVREFRCAQERAGSGSSGGIATSCIYLPCSIYTQHMRRYVPVVIMSISFGLIIGSN